MSWRQWLKLKLFYYLPCLVSASLLFAEFLFIFPPFSILLIHSHPWQLAVSIFMRLFHSIFGGGEKSAKGLEVYGATLFNLFFSCSSPGLLLRAESRVLWVLLSQETHYLSLYCCVFTDSQSVVQGPSEVHYLVPSSLQEEDLLLFHVLDINSVREALAVWIFSFIPCATWTVRF